MGAQAAAQGQSRALFLLGKCYRDGVGVDEDQDAASNFFDRAIHAGT